MAEQLPFTHVVLPNGLEVYIETSAVERTAVTVAIRTGFRHDPPRKVGLSHLLEHVLAAGTEGYPRWYATENESWLAENGLVWDNELVATYTEHTSFALRTAHHDKLGLLFQYLADLLFRPVFHPEDVRRELDNTWNEFAEESDSRRRRLIRAAYRNLYGDHPLAANDAEELKKQHYRMTASDLKRHHARFYRPDNMMLIISSPFPGAEILEHITRCFTQEVPHQAIFEEWSPLDDARPVGKRFASMAPEAVNFDLDFLWLIANPANLQVAKLASATLQHALFEDIRERHGLSYDVSSEVEQRSDHSLFSISTKAESRKEARQAEKLVRELLADEPRLRHYFEQARRIYIERIRSSDPPTVNTVHESYCLLFAARTAPRGSERLATEAEAVTVEDFITFVNAWLRLDQCTTTIYGV